MILGPDGATPLIAGQVHGFSVTCHIGPYPIDRRETPERAMYAELWPITDRTRTAMKRAGRNRILGCVPITAQAAAEIRGDPNGEVAEEVSRMAIGAASRLARQANSV